MARSARRSGLREQRRSAVALESCAHDLERLDRRRLESNVRCLPRIIFRGCLRRARRGGSLPVQRSLVLGASLDSEFALGDSPASTRVAKPCF